MVNQKLNTVGKMKKMALASAMVGALGIGLTFGSGDVEASENTYEVKSGDTLNQIAQKHQTSLDKLAQLNSIENINIIYPGQTIQLSGEVESQEQDTEEEQSNDGYHVVVSGDTLSKISDNYGITVSEIKSYNNLTSNLIFPGDELAVTANNQVQELNESEAPVVEEYEYVSTEPVQETVEQEPVQETQTQTQETQPEPQPVQETEPVEEKSSSQQATPSTTNVSSSTSSNATQSTSSNASGQNWGALANCESSGNASVVSANGLYHGLYQFDAQTWQSVGGTGVASDASAAEQTKRAQMLYDQRGSQPWPVCGAKL